MKIQVQTKNGFEEIDEPEWMRLEREAKETVSNEKFLIEIDKLKAEINTLKSQVTALEAK